jgi:hypothetical protein
MAFASVLSAAVVEVRAGLVLYAQKNESNALAEAEIVLVVAALHNKSLQAYLPHVVLASAPSITVEPPTAK